MPTVSEAQRRAMFAAAEGKSRFGIPKSVGEEFVAKDDADQAAGIVFVSPRGRILLMHRSPDEKNYGGHWGLPGGKAEDGETPEEAALRETKEETGYAHTGPLKVLDKVNAPNGMVFTTFAAPAEKEFAPKMADGEHTGFTWADPQHLPGPLHPSVAKVLGEHIGVTGDMSPEDWTELRSAFAKWTREEEDEPEHADDESEETKERAAGKFSERDKEAASSHVQHRRDMPESAFLLPAERKYPVKEKRSGKWRYDRDLLLGAAREARMHGHEELAKRADAIRQREFAQDAMAMDKGSVRKFDQDGHLHVEMTPISKAVVNPYYGHEIPGWETLRLDPDKTYNLYRDPEELAKAAPSFAGKPLLHIHTPVSADEHPKEVVVGSIGDDVQFVDPYLMAPLHIWDGDAIRLIESEAQKELSCGYQYQPDMTPGVVDGVKFDGVMRNIIGNHLALVPEGRAGRDVVVQDAALKTNGRAGPTAGDNHHHRKDKTMTIKTKARPGALDGKVRDELETEANSAIPAGAKAKDRKARDEERDERLERLRAALKEHGATDDMIDAACDAIEDRDEEEEGEDESPEERENNESEGEHLREREAREKADDKKAMDAAIKAAAKAGAAEARATERAIRQAERDVLPYVGELSMTFDSAEQVYRHTLKTLGVTEADTIHVSALPTILKMQPKPGAKPVVVDKALAADAASVSKAAEIAPGFSRIVIGA